MTNFQGAFTAIITPFLDNNSIDYEALKRLLKIQVENNIDGIVVLGTTGESPTIHEEESQELIKFVIKEIKGHASVVVGTGSNDTAETIKKSKVAEKLGADGLLLVNPYYNKPTQEGLYLHMTKVAQNVEIPILLYNIPGRTSVNIETPTLLRLIENNKNIVGVKEASGNLSQITDVIIKKPEDFTVVSGDDALFLHMLSLGGHGVISVLGNIMPREVKATYNLMQKKDLKTARDLHLTLFHFMSNLLSVGNNPIAIKTVLAHAGYIKANFRLPLCPLNKEQELFLINSYENTLRSLSDIKY